MKGTAPGDVPVDIEAKILNSELYSLMNTDRVNFMKVENPPKKLSRLWKAQSNHLNGTDQMITTMFGRQYYFNASDPPAVKNHAQKFSRMWRHSLKSAIADLPGETQRAACLEWVDKDVASIKRDNFMTTRGRLEVPQFWEKLKRYLRSDDIDDAALKRFLTSVDAVLTRWGKHFGARSVKPDIQFYDEWIRQAKWGSNSGFPYYETQNKELFDKYKRAIIGTKVTPGLLTEAIINGKWDEALLRKVSVYTLFHRSPYRPVHGEAFAMKYVSAFMNFYLNQGLKRSGEEIAWDAWSTMFSEIAERQEEAPSVCNEDFASYDGTWSFKLFRAISTLIKENQYFPDQLNNAIAFQLDVMSYAPRLIVTPQHAINLYNGLVSGSGATQFIGSVGHAALLHANKAELDLHYVRVLSDDSCAVSNLTLTKFKSQHQNEYIPFCKSLGFEVSPEKTYYADTTNGDCAPFLSTFAYSEEGERKYVGNIGRRGYNMLQKERDSINRLAPEFTVWANITTEGKKLLGRRGKRLVWPDELSSHLTRLSTLRPDCPGIERILSTAATFFPNFKRRFGVLRNSVKSEFLSIPIDVAGGTLDMGEWSPRWVWRAYNEFFENDRWPRFNAELDRPFSKKLTGQSLD